MNKNRITQSIIFSLVTLVASVNWFFLKQTLDCIGCSSSWLWPILISVLFFALIGISWFLVNSRIVIFVTSFAVVVSYLLVFGFDLFYLIAAAVCLLIIYFANDLSIREKNERKRINFSRVFHTGMPIVLVAVAILVSVAYYYSPQVTSLKNGISSSAGGYLNDATIEIINKSQADFNPAMTVNDFLMQFVGSDSLKMNAMLREILQLTEADLANATLKSLRDNVSKSIGISLTGNEKILDLMVDMVISKINIFIKNYYVIFSIILPISLFFAIKFLGTFILWLSLLLSWIAFKILIGTGAITIEIEKEPIEVIRC